MDTTRVCDRREALVPVHCFDPRMNRDHGLAEIKQKASHSVGRSPGVVAQAHDEPQATVGEQISNLFVGRQAPGHAVGRPSAR